MTDFGPVFTLAERNRFNDKYAESSKYALRLFDNINNFTSISSWYLLLQNFMASEVDKTNLQEIDTILALCKQKIRDAWFVCMACKWKNKYVDLNVAKPTYLDNNINKAINNAGGVSYETAIPEINWLLYMKNELDLIYEEYFQLNVLIDSTNKATITELFKRKWRERGDKLKQGMEQISLQTSNTKKTIQNTLTTMKNAIKDRLQANEEDKSSKDDSDDDIEKMEENIDNEMETLTSPTKVADKVKKQIQMLNKDEINEMLTSTQVILIDMIENKQTMRDIVYNFTLMSRNFLNVLTTGLSAYNCECCESICNEENSPCKAQDFCRGKTTTKNSKVF